MARPINRLSVQEYYRPMMRTYYVRTVEPSVAVEAVTTDDPEALYALAFEILDAADRLRGIVR